MIAGKRVHYLSMAVVALLAALGVYLLASTAPEPVMRGRMLVIPGAWWRFLGMFVLVTGGLAANSDLCAELLAQVGLQPELLAPWSGMTLAPNAMPPLSKGEEASFAAATGAALNLLEVA